MQQDHFRQFLNNQVIQKKQQKENKFKKKISIGNRKTKVDLGQEKKKEKQSLINENEITFSNPIDMLKHAKKYQFGNYRKYYQLRYDKRWNDPRLSVLSAEFFDQKRVLDIGCNDGTVSLQIALKYDPLLVRGVDIDYTLINKAVENMTELEKQQKDIQKREFQLQQEQPNESIDALKQKLEQIPKCFLINIEDKGTLHFIYPLFLVSEALDKIYLLDNFKDPLSNHKKQFPENVFFRIENFIENMQIREYYDTILCLSTTKWIHLNYGDQGIRRLFTKIQQSLVTKGVLILEPQDWKSYKKKKYLCDLFKQNYKEITLKPNLFSDVLQAQYGMQLIRIIRPDDSDAISKAKSAFKRSVYIFQKK